MQLSQKKKKIRIIFLDIDLGKRIKILYLKILDSLKDIFLISFYNESKKEMLSWKWNNYGSNQILLQSLLEHAMRNFVYNRKY